MDFFVLFLLSFCYTDTSVNNVLTIDAELQYPPSLSILLHAYQKIVSTQRSQFASYFQVVMCFQVVHVLHVLGLFSRKLKV